MMNEWTNRIQIIKVGIFDDDDVMVGIFMDLDGRVKGEFEYDMEDEWA